MSEIRCAHCNRLVKNPVEILGLTFGSECQSLYAGLEGALKAHGLEFPVRLELTPTDDGFFKVTPEIQAVMTTARGFGVTLAFVDVEDEELGTWVRCFTGLRRVTNDTLLKSYVQTRAEFVGQLQGAA